MADFTAKDVQALRQATGAGMMDAKRALEDTDGDFEAAKQWLREKGLADAGQARRSARAARAPWRCSSTAPARRPRRAQAARPTSWPSRDDVREAGQRPRRAVVAEGEADAVAQRDKEHRRPAGHAQGEHRGRPGRALRGRPRATSSTPTSTSRAAGASTACSSSSTAAASELAHDIAVHIAFARPGYLRRDDVPGRRGRRASGPRSRPSPATRASPSRPSPRSSRAACSGCFKDGVPARAALRQGRQAADQASCSAAAKVVRFAQVEIG